jgi:hypothetical protein
MHFDVVFEVNEQGWGGILCLLAGLALILVPALLTFFRRQIKSTVPAWIAWMVAIPFLSWMLVTGFNSVAGVTILRAALKSGRCEVTEGAITTLDPMPFEGHKYERFSVGRKEFYYSDFIKTPGFHHSVSHGGPLRLGQYVRIHHLGNDIARLEIAR